jgi:hypothetical protein
MRPTAAGQVKYNSPGKTRPNSDYLYRGERFIFVAEMQNNTLDFVQ